TTGEAFQSGNDFVVVSKSVQTHRFEMIGDLLESQRSSHTPLRRLALDLLGRRYSLDVSRHVSSLRVGGDRTNTGVAGPRQLRRGSSISRGRRFRRARIAGKL